VVAKTIDQHANQEGKEHPSHAGVHFMPTETGVKLAEFNGGNDQQAKAKKHNAQNEAQTRTHTPARVEGVYHQFVE